MHFSSGVTFSKLTLSMAHSSIDIPNNNRVRRVKGEPYILSSLEASEASMDFARRKFRLLTRCATAYATSMG